MTYGSVDNVVGTVDSNYYNGDTGMYMLGHYLEWDYNIGGGDTYPSEYEYSYGFTAAENLPAVNNFTTMLVIPSILGSEYFTTVRSTNPVGNWYHYRVRLKKLDGTYGPYVSTWAQIPAV